MTTILLLNKEDKEEIGDDESFIPIKKKLKNKPLSVNISPNKGKIINNKIDLIYQTQLAESVKISERSLENKQTIKSGIKIKVNQDYHLFFHSCNFLTRLSNKQTSEKIISQETSIMNKFSWVQLEEEVKENAFNTFNKEHYIMIKNKLIKLDDSKQLNFKTHSLKVSIRITMTGESSFWIFSRTNPLSLNSESDNLLIRIHKELESNRKFIEFGILYKEANREETSDYIVKILKKQEIPKHLDYNAQLDSSDFTLNIVDDGKTYCSLEFISGSFKQKYDANFFVPSNKTDSNIFLGGIGDVICISSISFYQYQSDSMNEQYVDNHNCSCCLIY